MGYKDERNAAIYEEYKKGVTIEDLCRKYRISRQWLHKILRKGKLGPREVFVGRDAFLGVNINEGTKNQVKKLADKRGVSVSALADEALREFVQQEKKDA